MAVVQISRIQLRRGKANSGTGLPQLASGEMAWAIDTQELWIGTGSVAEGAPYVDNIKVLTENDLSINGNILNLLQYFYKIDDPSISTGPTANTPISRSLQSRLDDRVNIYDFGAKGDGVTDDTAAIQRAINQLFLNSTTKASENTADGAHTRITLEFPAGVYNITDTLYIPSYATIVGAGAEKTIFEYSGTGTAIVFVNDDTTIGTYNSITGIYEPGNYPTTTGGITQPRFITLKGFTLFTNTTDQVALKLDSVTNCTIEDVYINGNWDGEFYLGSKGVLLTAEAVGVTCQSNLFKNVKVSGFCYGVFSKYDIIDNVFDGCYFTNLRHGFALGGDPLTTEFTLGTGYGSGPVAEQYGPRDTVITGCKFENVKRNGVYVYVGSGTNVNDSTFMNVGNNGGGNLSAEYPQVYYRTYRNTVSNIKSDRSDDLANPTTEYLTVPYVPEASGHVVYSSPSVRELRNNIGVTSTNVYEPLFRLPASTDAYGIPGPAAGFPVSPGDNFPGTISYKINYTYISSENNFIRNGVLTIVANLNDAKIELSDDYEYIGTEAGDQSYNLDFRASFLTRTGSAFVGSYGQRPYSIQVRYSNQLTGDAGTFVYSYTSIS